MGSYQRERSLHWRQEQMAHQSVVVGVAVVVDVYQAAEALLCFSMAIFRSVQWSSRTWTRISRWFDNPQAPNHEGRSCPHGTGEAREREDGINGFYAWRVWKHASFGQCS